MRNTGKKFASLLAAVACLTTACSFAGCGEGSYKGTALGGNTEGKAISNGGFAVEKGDYVYFINGVASNADDNTYGEVEKGALVRIKTTDLNEGKNNVETVIPSLFVAGSYNGGVFIYGDRVYFATPTTSKNSKGEVMNSMLDFKSAKLDGSETMKDEYFRVESNSTNYRFVEENGVVYCLYEEDGALKSFNTKDKTDTTLVKGGTYTFDSYDLTNPTVYYTMGVTYNVDAENSTTAQYNQLYKVNASATVSVDSEKASYTAKGEGYERTYDFDENFLKEKNKEVEKKEDKPYDLDDYTTYPYVNLGRPVLDGVGKFAEDNVKNDGRYNWNGCSDATEGDGYTYTVAGYKNGGVYFTRASINKTGSDGEDSSLYFLADTEITADWNSVTANKLDDSDIVAYNTTNASDKALFLYDEEKKEHTYLYLANENLYKGSKDNEKEVRLLAGVGEINLYKTEGDYLYYYATGTNGSNLTRINYKGEDKNYIEWGDDEYKPVTLAIVDWKTDWYKPEIFGDTVLYANAQSFGAEVFNYVYKATFDGAKERNEKYEAVQEYISEATTDETIKTAMNFYFRNPSDESIDTIKELYEDNTKLIEKVEEFAKELKENQELLLEKDVIQFIGKQTEDDAEAIKQAFIDSMTTAEETEEEEEKGLETWAIVLIVVASVLVVAGGVVAVLVILNKKKAKKAEQEATVNAYKRTKIDTTDDKTIDVYADEDEVAEEATVVEETTAEEVEVVEEASEAEAEEVQEEAPQEVEEGALEAEAVEAQEENKDE